MHACCVYCSAADSCLAVCHPARCRRPLALDLQWSSCVCCCLPWQQQFLGVVPAGYWHGVAAAGTMLAPRPLWRALRTCIGTPWKGCGMNSVPWVIGALEQRTSSSSVFVLIAMPCEARGFLSPALPAPVIELPALLPVFADKLASRASYKRHASVGDAGTGLCWCARHVRSRSRARAAATAAPAGTGNSWCTQMTMRTACTGFRW